jgi:hypothetical protein
VAKWSSLWSPLYARTNQPVFHHPGIQECPDEFEQPLVRDSFGDLAHQFVVIHSANWLFVGSDRGGKTMAILRSFVGSCEMVKVDPFAWF